MLPTDTHRKAFFMAGSSAWEEVFVSAEAGESPLMEIFESPADKAEKLLLIWGTSSEENC